MSVVSRDVIMTLGSLQPLNPPPPLLSSLIIWLCIQRDDGEGPVLLALERHHTDGLAGSAGSARVAGNDSAQVVKPTPVIVSQQAEQGQAGPSQDDAFCFSHLEPPNATTQLGFRRPRRALLQDNQLGALIGRPDLFALAPPRKPTNDKGGFILP